MFHYCAHRNVTRWYARDEAVRFSRTVQTETLCILQKNGVLKARLIIGFHIKCSWTFPVLSVWSCVPYICVIMKTLACSGIINNRIDCAIFCSIFASFSKMYPNILCYHPKRGAKYYLSYPTNDLSSACVRGAETIPLKQGQPTQSWKGLCPASFPFTKQQLSPGATT